MNILKYLMMALSIISIGNLISMEKVNIEKYFDYEEQESPLLKFPLELLICIIKPIIELKTIEEINNWNDIFQESNQIKINLDNIKEISKKLYNSVNGTLTSKTLKNIIINLKQDRFNYLKEQIKKQYKGISTEDLNEALIDILNKWEASEEDLKGAVRLIIAGADVNVKDNYGNTALSYASMKSHEEIVEILINAKADLNVTNKYGYTALMFASRNSHKDIVKILIEANADVDAKDNDGDTALMDAARKGHKEIVQMLIEAKANVNAANNEGQTALIIASKKGHKEIVQILIKACSDVNARDRYGMTALMFASLTGNKEIVEMLIKAGADVNATNKYGYTALMNASECGHKEIVKILIEANADVDAKDNNEWSALMFASYYGYKEIVEILIKQMLMLMLAIKIAKQL